MERKYLGRIGLSRAIDYFTMQGYTVSIPLNDTQWYDLIVEKDGILELVQCKSTVTEKNEIDFRSTGGTKGYEYDNILNHPELKWLFCVDKDFNCYNIPIEDIRIAGNMRAIKLRSAPNANNEGFETYKYLIK